MGALGRRAKRAGFAPPSLSHQREEKEPGWGRLGAKPLPNSKHRLLLPALKKNYTYLYFYIMNAYVFPGQGAQFVGMGKSLYEGTPLAKTLFEQANDILGFRITDLMFAGTDDDLKQTKVTQPAVFLHSVILARTLGDDFRPDMTAGHSLGEFSSLVASRALSFADGLWLVSNRPQAHPTACVTAPSTMASILRLPAHNVHSLCNECTDDVVL